MCEIEWLQIFTFPNDKNKTRRSEIQEMLNKIKPNERKKRTKQNETNERNKNQQTEWLKITVKWNNLNYFEGI